MQVLDRTGVGTLWSMCKTKFALKDHSHNYLPLSGGTLTGDLLFSNSGTTFRQIRGTCGDNDFWRIGGGATGNNAGYMEIATADDGTEPIYVRQYSGTFSTITRTATLLDGSGNTSFPGTVAAAKFKGALEGNASTASNAGNADTVDGYHANGLLTSVTNTNNGISVTVGGTTKSVSNISVNYAASAGSANSAIQATNLTPENTPHYFRDPSSSGWRGGMYWGSAGNESMSFVAVNGDTRFQFVGGSDIANWTSSTWQSVTPYLTIYSSGIVTPGSVTATNGFIKSGSSDSYVLLGGGGHKAESSLRVAYASSAGNADTVNGHTVNANVPSNAKFTDTNTWRPIQDNLTSTSTSDSLSANQGRVLKGLVDSKANSNEVIKSVSVELYGDTHSGFTPTIVVKDNANQKQAFTIDKANGRINGLMSIKDKNKLDLIPDDLSNLCRFNFINSISECRNGKINFFLKMQISSNTILDIKDFENCEEGTILLLSAYYNGDGYIRITNSAHNWYVNMDPTPAGQDRYSNTGKIILATIESGEIYVFIL